MDPRPALAFFSGFSRNILEAIALDDCEEAADLLQQTDDHILRTVNIPAFIEQTWRNDILSKLDELEQLVVQTINDDDIPPLDHMMVAFDKIHLMLCIYYKWLDEYLLEELDLDTNRDAMTHSIARWAVIGEFIEKYQEQ